VPFVIIGDPKRLRQIIMNLMGNALKFTQEGSVTIKITRDCRVLSVPQGTLGLRFEIIDSGIGMRPEVCERLFKPFSQADNSTSRKFGGTGLGLSICKKLVELMGGEIGVTSIEGVGSTFWFEIPTREVGTDVNAAPLPKLEGLSVLSVEDHPQGAKEIVKSLRSMGADIESCPTYKEALDLIKRRPFDVGIIDQGLPDGLGLDLIREIVQLRPFMGLIMYTVRDDAGLQHTLQSLGVTYLTKPASRIGLGEAVKDAAAKVKRHAVDGPTRMVIAEDTESVRDVLRRQLDKLGVDATFVTNGREALEAYESGNYGILVTDLHMPEIDGYEVVRRIRDMEKGKGAAAHFPVIVLTADVQMAQRQVYLSHGFDECLLKPVSLGQFRRLLMRWGLLKEPEMVGEVEAQGGSNAGADWTASRKAPAIDRAAIIAQMGAMDSGTIEMLKMFVDMTVPLVGKIKSAHEAGNSHDLRETAHSLKGAARSACANVLGDLAAQIQTAAESGQPIGALADDVLAEFERVKKEIEVL
jgi:CheY-like chemotaxis protein